MVKQVANEERPELGLAKSKRLEVVGCEQVKQLHSEGFAIVYNVIIPYPQSLFRSVLLRTTLVQGNLDSESAVLKILEACQVSEHRPLCALTSRKLVYGQGIAPIGIGLGQKRLGSFELEKDVVEQVASHVDYFELENYVLLPRIQSVPEINVEDVSYSCD